MLTGLVTDAGVGAAARARIAGRPLASGAGPRRGLDARQAATDYVLETVRKRLER